MPALGRPEVVGVQALAMSAGSLPESEEAIAYTYDAADRLTGAAYSGGDSYGYAYDAVGNRTALDTILGGVSDSTSYTYDAGDRITSVDGAPYTYDNRGNLTSDGTWTYTYDGAGRMVRAEKPGTVNTYVYNGDGLLVSETVDGVETVFTWDLALAIPQVLATSDGTKNLYGLEAHKLGRRRGWPRALGASASSRAAPGATRCPMRWAPCGSGRTSPAPCSRCRATGPLASRGSPLARRRGGRSRLAAGGVGRAPKGRSRLAAGGVGRAPKGFTGEWQGPAGMVYLRARWHNPALGRFTQVDPIAGTLLEPATQHPYAYGLNNPLRYTDPTGYDAGAVPWWSVWQEIQDAIAAMGPLAAAGAPEVVALGAGTAALAIGSGYATVWAIQDEGPDYPYPMEYTPGQIGASYPLAGTSTVRSAVTLDTASLLAARGRAETVADHIGYLTGGEVQFPGMPPLEPNKTKNKRPGGGTDQAWLRELKTRFGEWARKYPGQTLEQILQKESGYCAQKAAEYVRLVARFAQDCLPGLGELPEVNPETVEQLQALLQQLGVY